jgi:hypothetical protein
MRERWDSRRGSIHRDDTLAVMEGCVNVLQRPSNNSLPPGQQIGYVIEKFGPPTRRVEERCDGARAGVERGEDPNQPR